MQVNPSGYYDWLREPQSRREQEDKRLTVFIKQFWLERLSFWLPQYSPGLDGS